MKLSNKQQEYVICFVLIALNLVAVYFTKIIPTPILLILSVLILGWFVYLFVIDEIKFRRFARDFWG